METRIEIILGDITTLKVDAIINAANNSLLGGGGVDGAIHDAAGHELLVECRALNGCETGQAKITKGYNLPAKYIIHTVGSIWSGGDNNERELLANCYKNCLRLAAEKSIKTIAFPSISTGVYGFPIEEAAKIALKEITRFISNYSKFEKVVLVCYDTITHQIYVQKFNELNRNEIRIV